MSFVARLRLLSLLAVFSYPVEIRGEEPLPEFRIADRNTKFKLVGLLNHPFGTPIKIQGVMAHDPDKAGGPYFRVQRINGIATQEHIPIELEAYIGDFGDPEYGEIDGSRIGLGLPTLEQDKTYEFEGYETGKFTGIPWDAYKRAGVIRQTSGYGFSHRFIVIGGEVIKPIVFAPADFADREALLQGRATSTGSRAFITGEGCALEVDDKKTWPTDIEGKTVEGLGTVRKTTVAREFKLEKAKSQLVKLEDQVGRKVAIRGYLNHYYRCLKYRGTLVYVDGLETLPDHDKYFHADAIEITGVLEEEMLPDINGSYGAAKPPITKQYILRKPVCTPTTRLLSVEREGNVR